MLVQIICLSVTCKTVKIPHLQSLTVYMYLGLMHHCVVLVVLQADFRLYSHNTDILFDHFHCFQIRYNL